ncbi:hypothetical protein V502_01746 [Pseudogymnoascus sp. VKM F-4520 (FW-2644)]|nr:hypothetical protein V502_01746 [Pseudogymnoascus sp. VKM F-4520 (FW-2644)]
MNNKPIPKTLALGLTKITPDGKVVSINHPNPTGEVCPRKTAYRSHKHQKAKLLPKGYTPDNSNAQNGSFQCPVKDCIHVFTRKAGLLLHMERENGHLHDTLRDDGDGTFTKIGPAHDMRDVHAGQNEGLQDGGYFQQPSPPAINAPGSLPAINAAVQEIVPRASHAGQNEGLQDGGYFQQPSPPAINAPGSLPAINAAVPEIVPRAGPEPNLPENAELRIDLFESLGVTGDYPAESELSGELLEKYRRFRYVSIDDLLSFAMPDPWE